MTRFQMDREKIARLEKVLVSLDKKEAGKLLLAIDDLFKSLEGDAFNAKQSASYPGFNPDLHRIAAESIEIVAERIYDAREYFQTKAKEYSSQ
jgi:hypothetical protein